MTENTTGNGQPAVTEPPFLPDFCNVRMVFAVVITAQLLAMVMTLVSITRLDQFASAFSVLSLYVMWIALMEAGLLCVLKKPLSRLSPTVKSCWTRKRHHSSSRRVPLVCMPLITVFPLLL